MTGRETIHGVLGSDMKTIRQVVEQKRVIGTTIPTNPSAQMRFPAMMCGIGEDHSRRSSQDCEVGLLHIIKRIDRVVRAIQGKILAAEFPEIFRMSTVGESMGKAGAGFQ